MSHFHPVPENEKERLQALRNYHILDTLPEEKFDRITRLAAAICEVPTALVSLVDEDRQWFKSRQGVEVQQTSREDSFCQHTIMDDFLLEVEDALKDQRFAENPLVVGNPHIRFYAGFPLTDPEGYSLGSLCVIDKRPRKLSEHQRTSLKILAQEVTEQIVASRQQKELANYKRLFQLSHDMICVAGTDGYFQKVNPAFSQVLGWSETQLMGKPFYKLIHPDDIEVTRQEIRKLAGGSRTINFINRFRTSKGAYRSLQWVAAPDADTGQLYAIARDITSQLRFQQALDQERRRFDQIIQGTNVGTWEWNVQSGNTIFNERWAEIIGYTLEELQPVSIKTWEQFAHPEDLKRSGDLLQEHFAGKTPFYECETRMRHKEGHWVWVLDKGKVLSWTEEGQPLMMYGSHQDISEQKAAALELQRTKEMLEQTSQVARVGGWEVDLLKERIHWSDITRQIHEVPQDFEPSLQSGINFYKEGESRDTILRLVGRAVEKGKPFEAELPIITAKGREVWVRAIAKAEMKYGKCIRLYGTFQDISREKENELHLKLLESVATRTHDAVLITRADPMDQSAPKIMYVNNAFTRITGYTAEEAIGQNPWMLHGPETDRQELDKIRASVEKEQPFEAELINYRKNGETYWTHFSGVPVTDKKGKITHWISVARDISQQKSAEQKLIQAKEQAEAGSVAKSEFLANMSHEIRTPLNSVIGFSELLLNTHMDEIQEQYMRAVNQSANTLLDLINDILDFSKIEAGKLELAPEPTDLYALAEQVMNVVTYKAEEKGLSLQLDLSQEIPRYVQLDPVRIRQVLINLLGNAVKFTEKGQVTLSIQASERNGAHATLKFAVQDTGIGISKHKQQKIFETFSQEDNSITRKYGGTGLGLGISNKLLALMNSRLELESEAGSGSCFYFSLVCRVSEERDLNPTAEKQGEADKLSAKQAHISILIVDDVEYNILLTQGMLKNFLPDARLLEAKSGEEAVGQFEKHRPHIVLMDVQMPGMSGYEATRRIRQAEEGKKPVIIALTAGTVKGESEKCLQSGMDDYLSKPITMQSLQDKISKWLAATFRTSAKAESLPANEKEVHFDYRAFKQVMGMEDEMLWKILDTLFGQLHAAPAELEKAMRQKDIHRLQQIGHRLKGSVSSAKMYRLEALSRQLEEQQQFEEDMLGKLVGEICEEIRLVLRRAEEILGSRV